MWPLPIYRFIFGHNCIFHFTRLCKINKRRWEMAEILRNAKIQPKIMDVGTNDVFLTSSDTCSSTSLALPRWWEIGAHAFKLTQVAPSKLHCTRMRQRTDCWLIASENEMCKNWILHARSLTSYRAHSEIHLSRNLINVETIDSRESRFQPKIASASDRASTVGRMKNAQRHRT